jgi:hypothetical protein
MKEMKLCVRCREHKTGHRDQVCFRCKRVTTIRITGKRKRAKRLNYAANTAGKFSAHIR